MTETKNPKPNLPPRPMFVDAEKSGTRSASAKIGNTVVTFVTDDTPASEVLISASLRGRGRPKSTEPKPWDAADVSRALWYRRQKAKPKA